MSSIEEVRQAIKDYRRTRQSRSSRIPSSVREAVLSLLPKYSLQELSRELDLRANVICKWQKRRSALKSIDPFIEIANPLSAANDFKEAKFCLEFMRSDKASLRIEVMSGIGDVSRLIQVFLGGELSCLS